MQGPNAKGWGRTPASGNPETPLGARRAQAGAWRPRRPLAPPHSFSGAAPPAARGRRRAASAPRRSMPPQPRYAARRRCSLCAPLALPRPAARRRCSLRGYPGISRRATSRSRPPRALLPLTEAVLIFGSGRGRVGGGDEGVIGAGVGRAGSEWVWHGENWLGRLVGWLESVGCWV